jgi:ATP synthase in type III secretion protein N
MFQFTMPDLAVLQKRAARANVRPPIGSIVDISANRINTTLEGLAIGEFCTMQLPRSDEPLYGQVIGVQNGKAILSPFGSLEGLSVDTPVHATGRSFSFAGGDWMLGRVFDGIGKPIDGKPIPEDGLQYLSVNVAAPSPLERPLIDQPLVTGIKSIDGLNTLGKGQRIALFGSPGSGKSTLMGSLARNCESDVCVLALVGERGRELREFLDRWLPPEFLARCVVVTATSDRPAMERMMAGDVAISVANYFRETGRDVLLLFDSMTRYCRALREVGLAAGEQPVRRGYTASVYSELPKLVERCGRSAKGSISAIFTVLTEDDGVGDPIAEEVMSLTDGHVVLSQQLAQSGLYPAVDVLRSKSRLMSAIGSSSHVAAANRMRSLIAKYKEIELLIQVGEYKHGGDALADQAVAARETIQSFLGQDTEESVAFDETVQLLSDIVGE